MTDHQHGKQYQELKADISTDLSSIKKGYCEHLFSAVNLKFQLRWANS